MHVHYGDAQVDERCGLNDIRIRRNRRSLPRPSMPMGVVHVGNMGMRVAKPLVLMPVGMRFSNRIIP